MKKNSGIALILPLMMLLIFGSCAKEQTMSFDEQEQLIFDAWMSKNTANQGLERLSSGLYMKIIPAANPGKKVADHKEGWLKISYTGRTLDSSVFVTYYPDLAKQLGTFTNFTHYVSDYVPNVPGYMLTKGQYEALSKMSEGDSVVMYMPSAIGYQGSAFAGSGGFGGNVGLEANKPFMMSLKLNEVIPNAYDYELKQVMDYAQTKLLLGSADSLKGAKGMYLRKLKTCPDSSKITQDSSTFINYVGRFLDGFVLDTNIESYAKELDIYIEPTSSESASRYVPLSYTPKDGGLITAFYKAVVGEMRYGEVAEFVFVSTWGYGLDGSTQGPTKVNPYTPLTYTIQIQRADTSTFDTDLIVGKIK